MKEEKIFNAKTPYGKLKTPHGDYWLLEPHPIPGDWESSLHQRWHVCPATPFSHQPNCYPEARQVVVYAASTVVEIYNASAILVHSGDTAMVGEYEEEPAW